MRRRDGNEPVELVRCETGNSVLLPGDVPCHKGRVSVRAGTVADVVNALLVKSSWGAMSSRKPRSPSEDFMEGTGIVSTALLALLLRRVFKAGVPSNDDIVRPLEMVS